MKQKIFFLGIIIVSIILVRNLLIDNKIENNVMQKDQLVQEIYIVSQGQRHITLDEVHPSYNSVPPTSGWHYKYPANWGVYDIPVQDEILVHNLEHGGIIIRYKTDIEKEVIVKLEEIVNRYEKKVIIAPYHDSKLNKNIALTAWNYLDKFDTFDEKRIIEFITRHINQGPEHVDD